MIQLKLPNISSKVSLIVIICCLAINYVDCGNQCGIASFPKIIGGLQGNTEITQLELHADSLTLVLAGHTEDDSIIGSELSGSKYPFIQLHSGAGMLYVWSRVVNAEGQSLVQLAINSNGKLIVAATQGQDGEQKLLIVRAADGVYLNALTASDLGILSKNNYKSIIMSNLNDENYKIYTASVTPISKYGQQVQILAFTSSSNATINSTWGYMTEHFAKMEVLGLVFGTNESQQLAYYQYITPQGQQRRVLLFFIGSTFLSYNMKKKFITDYVHLISMYDQYLAVDSSQIIRVLLRQNYYKDFKAYKFNDDQSLIVTGVTMQNTDTLVMTYFSQNDGITYLAIASFQSRQVNSITILPKFSGRQIRGAFDANLIYYSAQSAQQFINSNTLGQGLVKNVQFSKNQGIVYSSNSTEGCYSFITEGLKSLGSQDLFDSSLDLSEHDVYFNTDYSPIFNREPLINFTAIIKVNVSFQQDASQLSDKLIPLLQKKMIQSDAWCPSKITIEQYANINSTQVNKVVYQDEKMQKNHSITIFTADKSCEGFSPQFTYSATLSDLTPLPYYVKIDPATGTIRVANMIDYEQGIFQILITGTLPTKQKTSAEVTLIMRLPETANRTKAVPIYISKMTLNGTFSLDFGKNCESITPQITNQSFKLALKKNLTNFLPVIILNEKEYKNTEMRAQDIQFAIGFENFDDVSVSSVDQAHLIIQEDLYCRYLNVFYVIKSGTKTEQEIPYHELSQSLISAYQQYLIGAAASVSTVSFSSVVSMLSGNGLGFLWSKLTFLTMLVVISRVSANTPESFATDLVNIVYNFAQLDILPATQIFEEILEFDQDSDSALSSQFDKLGVGSKNCINVMQSAFLYLIFYVALWLFFFIEGKVSARIAAKYPFEFTPRFMRMVVFYKDFKESMIWSGFIKGIIAQYPTFQIAGLLNTQRINTELSGELVATITFPFLLLLTLIFPFFLHYLVYKNHDKLDDKEWKDRYTSITEGLDLSETKNFAGKYWNILQLYIFMAINLIQMYLPDYPIIQLVLIITIQIGAIIFLHRADPIEGGIDKKFERINQYIILAYILVYFGIASTNSDTLDPRSNTFKLRTAFTWLSVFLLAAAILFSVFSIYYKNVHTLRKIKEYLLSIKLMSLLRRFRKEGIDLTEPKKPGTWNLKQFSDYLIAQTEVHQPEKQVEVLFQEYLNRKILLSSEQRSQLKEIFKKFDQTSLSKVIDVLEPKIIEKTIENIDSINKEGWDDVNFSPDLRGTNKYLIEELDQKLSSSRFALKENSFNEQTEVLQQTQVFNGRGNNIKGEQAPPRVNPDDNEQLTFPNSIYPVIQVRPGVFKVYHKGEIIEVTLYQGGKQVKMTSDGRNGENGYMKTFRFEFAQPQDITELTMDQYLQYQEDMERELKRLADKYLGLQDEYARKLKEHREAMKRQIEEEKCRINENKKQRAREQQERENKIWAEEKKLIEAKNKKEIEEQLQKIRRIKTNQNALNELQSQKSERIVADLQQLVLQQVNSEKLPEITLKKAVSFFYHQDENSLIEDEEAE